MRLSRSFPQAFPQVRQVLRHRSPGRDARRTKSRTYFEHNSSYATLFLSDRFAETSIIPTMALLDTFQRPMRDLRISVTDRCNFRCTYCMPFDEYTWIERNEVLSFEEIERIARIFLTLGVEKIRLTGGEPLVRR